MFLIPMLFLLFACSSGAAYFTNLLWILHHMVGTVTVEMAVSLVGLVVPPIGVFHGVYLWF